MLSFKLQHVHPLLPLLLFHEHKTMCVQMCKWENKIAVRLLSDLCNTRLTLERLCIFIDCSQRNNKQHYAAHRLSGQCHPDHSVLLGASPPLHRLPLWHTEETGERKGEINRKGEGVGGSFVRWGRGCSGSEISF